MQSNESKRLHDHLDDAVGLAAVAQLVTRFSPSLALPISLLLLAGIALLGRQLTGAGQSAHRIVLATLALFVGSIGLLSLLQSEPTELLLAMGLGLGLAMAATVLFVRREQPNGNVRNGFLLYVSLLILSFGTILAGRWPQ